MMVGVLLAFETLKVEAAVRWLPRSRFKSPQPKGRCPQAMTFPHVPGVPAVVPHRPRCCQPGSISGLLHLQALLPGVPAVGVLVAFPKVELRLKGTRLCGLYDRRTKLGGLQAS